MSELIIIVGMRGTGKTTSGKVLTSNQPRVVAFDPLGDFTAPTRVTTFQEFVEASDRMKFDRTMRITYHPDEKNTTVAFDYFADALMALQAEARSHYGPTFPPLTVMVDEAGTFMQVNKSQNAFNRMLRFSRHSKINVICATHRGIDIPVTFCALASSIYTFRQQEMRDLKYWADFYGDKRIAERIRNLPMYHFIRYDGNPDSMSRISSGQIIRDGDRFRFDITNEKKNKH